MLVMNPRGFCFKGTTWTGVVFPSIEVPVYLQVLCGTRNGYLTCQQGKGWAVIFLVFVF